MAGPASRKPRADAERNRAKVLEAARVLFAERGDEVQLPEVARAAGVGVGTVYRHFPTRQDLVEATAEHRFEQILDYAWTVCRDSVGRGDGVERYLRYVGKVLDDDRGLSASIEAIRGAPGSAPKGRSREQLEEAVGVLIEQGRTAGTLRDDLTVSDVYMLVGCVSTAIRAGSGDWRRLVDLALDGVRPRPAAPTGR
ncbi:TetR/AcrR family transcriptional regulator [Amycolatopsis nigrescens]|uniref:TetR/AcrR family transcriptional regulator n=1 Tax=Amycolatopsis nigrescens TaxID=381445 RepID=UPI00035ED245|nr:TetR/AcrR family transcriptional regulator [Amycolatopsis nigrescens]